MTYLRRLLALGAGVTFALILLSAYGILFLPELEAQGTLSNQVLALLSRTNSWIGTNTFYDIRIPAGALPSVTTDRLYADTFHQLYFNGAPIGSGGGGTTPHNLLSSMHPDTVPDDPSPGDMIIADDSPAWTRLGICNAGEFIGSDGVATGCQSDGSGLTNLDAAALTGDLPAINGAALVELNASALLSGTIPLARIVGITNTQVASGAAIAYAKLALTGGILNADINASAAIAYSKLALAGTIVNADISGSAAIALTKIAQTGATSGQVIAWNGSAWAPASPGAGTVTSVALAVPGILSVSGSPITSTGTITIGLATETANTIWSGPTTGSAATPTFRALVAADIPALAGSKLTTGVIAIGDGSNSAPTYSFAAETTTGFFRNASNQIGTRGSLIWGTDATYDIGGSITTLRPRHLYISGNAAMNTLQIGAGASTTNNVLLSNQYVNSGGANGAGMLTITTGTSSGPGDLFLNRIAAGNSGEPTFATYSTTWNFLKTYTGADPAARVVDFYVANLDTPSANLTEDHVTFSVENNAAGTHNYTGLIGAYLASYAGTSGTVTANVAADADGEMGGSGTATLNVGLRAQAGGFGTSTITTNNVVRLLTPYKGTALTNHYGLYIEDQTLAATTIDEAIYYAAPTSKQFHVLANGEVVIGGASPATPYAGGLFINSVLQANLGTPTNGTILFCSDCTTASACTAAGTGALAVRQNGAWKCF